MGENYSSYEKIIVEVTPSRVGVITLNNPPDNDMGLTVLEEIYDAMERMKTDSNVRCVMLTHTGKNFCESGAGSDEVEMSRRGYTFEEFNKMFAQQGAKLVRQIDEYDKPTLVCGRGHCFGAGAAIYSAFDIRIAGESFNLEDGDIYWGGASSWGMRNTRMPAWISRYKLYDLEFLKETFYARQLFEAGIVSRVYSESVLDVCAMKIASDMARSAPITVAEFKKCVRNIVYGDNLDSWTQFATESAARNNASEDARGAAALWLQGGNAEDYDFQGR